MKTKHRKFLLIGAVVAMMALAGCMGDIDTTSSTEDLNEDTNQNVGESEVEIGDTATWELQFTEENQQTLVREHPPFKLDESLERKNILRRLEYLNNENNVHHVYGYTENGQILFYETAQGKVSSVNSKLTNDKQIVGSERCIDTTHHDGEGACFKALESPQLDGSYGTNGAAIFFFTTDGHYFEYNGKYVVSEQPKDITTQVTLTNDTDV